MIPHLLFRLTSVGVAIPAPAVIVVADVTFAQPTVSDLTLEQPRATAPTLT